MEPQRPRRRCSLVRVLIGVVVFALVVFVATHGMLQSLHAAQDELTHLERFGHDLLYRGHFVREPTDGVEVLCDDGGCRSVPQELVQSFYADAAIAISQVRPSFSRLLADRGQPPLPCA